GRSGAVVCRRRRRPEELQLRRDDQHRTPGALGDAGDLGGARRCVRVHVPDRSAGEPLCRRSARRVRSARTAEERRGPQEPGPRMSAVAEPMLSVSGLSTVLETESGLARAVDALSISIDRRETFALVGESGSGKSMTALSLLRLLPDNGRIEAGSVVLGGPDLSLLREFDMQRVRGARIGIIFQEPATSLNAVMPVGRQITEVIERHTELRGAAARTRAIEWLERVGLPEPQRRVDSYPFQMSGGQK